MVRLHAVLLFIFLKICALDAGINLFKKNSCTHFASYYVSPVNPSCYNDPNVKSTLPAMITRIGYPVEVHPITTKDGFILILHRIPRPGAQPLIIQHGVATSGHVWADRNESLAYEAYDRGYDTWLTALRGTTYGKGHLRYTESDDEYWSFNLDITANEDLPAIITYIAEVTGRKGDIIFIGHSMGTTLSYMFAVDNPTMASEYLRGIVSMSPVAYIDKNKLFKAMSPFGGAIRATLSLLGIRSVFRHDKFIQSVSQGICRVLPFGCYLLIQGFAGKDPKQFKSDYLLLYYASWFVSISVDQLIQYLQIVQTEKFQHFDHGQEKNKEIYGAEVPPLYDLSKITIPTVLLYGKNDFVCPVENVQRLFSELGSEQKEMIEISQDGKTPFNHINFEYSKDQKELLYNPLFEAIGRLMKPKGQGAEMKKQLEQQSPVSKSQIKQAQIEAKEKLAGASPKVQQAKQEIEKHPKEIREKLDKEKASMEGIKKELNKPSPAAKAEIQKDEKIKVKAEMADSLTSGEMKNEIEKQSSKAEEKLEKEKVKLGFGMKPPPGMPSVKEEKELE